MTPETLRRGEETQAIQPTQPIEAQQLPPEQCAKISKETQKQLEKFKREIEAGYLDVATLKTMIESLKEVPKEQKPFVLGIVLYGINRRGISFEGIKAGKIQLKEGKESALGSNIASSEDVALFQNMIQGGMNAGYFTTEDLHKALLYRTFSIQNYINSQIGENLGKTSKYVVFLLKKYKLHITGITIEEGGSKIGITMNKEQYESFRQVLLGIVTDNQEDKEFLIAYFDDVFYNELKGFKESDIAGYKKVCDSNTAQMMEQFSELPDDTKASLGLRDSSVMQDKLNKRSRDPLSAIQDSFRNGGAHLGIFLGIIGALFWGKKGFFAGLIGGLGFGAVGSKGIADMIKGGFEHKSDPLYNKYKEVVQKEKRGDLDKNVLNSYFKALIQDEKFLASDAKNIKIFNQGKSDEDIKKYFSTIGIELQDEDMKYFKQIFQSLYRKQKEEGVGEPQEGQTMKDYLRLEPANEGVGAVSDAVSGVGAGAVAGGSPVTGGGSESPGSGAGTGSGITGEGVPPLTTPERPNIPPEESPEELQKLLIYFGINDNQGEINNFFYILQENEIELNPYNFLNKYREYIEANIGESYREKIKKSIGKRLLYALKEIDIEEMKKKEMENHHGSMSDFKNNRWIINDKIKSSFDEIDTKILPTAVILTHILDENGKVKNGISLSDDQKEQLKQAQEMFGAELNNDGTFDRKMWSDNTRKREVWDAWVSNNWDTFDSTSEISGVHIQPIEGNTLLSEEDQDIADSAEFTAIALLIGQIGLEFTPIGWTVGAIIDVSDMCSDEDMILKGAKMMPWVDSSYRAERHWYDNVLAGIGLIPGATILTKGTKVADYVSKLKPDKLEKLREIVGKTIDWMGKKAGWDDSTILKWRDEIFKRFFGLDKRVFRDLAETKLDEITKQITKIESESNIIKTKLLQNLKTTLSQERNKDLRIAFTTPPFDEFRTEYKTIIKSTLGNQALRNTQLDKFVDDIAEKILKKGEKERESFLDPTHHEDNTTLTQLEDDLLKLSNKKPQVETLRYLNVYTDNKRLEKILDDLLKDGTEIDIDGLKISKVGKEYIAKDPTTGAVICKNENMTEFLLHDEILITPNDIIIVSLKQNIVSDATKLNKLNTEVVKIKPIKIGDDEFTFSIDTTGNLQIWKKDPTSSTGKISIPSNDSIHAQVINQFNIERLPQIADRLYDIAMGKTLGSLIPTNVLNSLLIKTQQIAGFPKWTFEQFKNLPFGEYLNFLDKTSNSTVIRWIKDKSIKRGLQFLTLNTGAALVVSAVEEGIEDDDELWNDFFDRAISYNIVGPILGETNEWLDSKWGIGIDPTKKTGIDSLLE